MIGERFPLASCDFDDTVSNLFGATRIQTGNRHVITLWTGVGVEVATSGGKTRIIPFTKVRSFEMAKLSRDDKV